MKKATLILFTILYLLLTTFPSFAQDVFVHTANSSNINKHMTSLDYSSLNNNGDALIFITQHFGKYNNHQVGVWYDGRKWFIYHEDLAAMPSNTKFNVLVRRANDRIFQHKATASNIKDNWTVIDHPKCNNNPNAVLFITQHYKGVYNPKAIGVWYTGSRWAIYNQDKTAMTNGVNFNVIVQTEGRASGLENASVYTGNLYVCVWNVRF